MNIKMQNTLLKKTSPSLVRKKEISWSNYENINLKDVESKRSEVCVLNRKASVGPCFKNIGPFEGRSGITICLPKKSLKCVHQPSGISVNISRKNLAKSKSTVNDIAPTEHKNRNADNKPIERVNREIGFANFIDNIKEKVSSAQSKIKSFFHS